MLITKPVENFYGFLLAITNKIYYLPLH